MGARHPEYREKNVQCLLKSIVEDLKAFDNDTSQFKEHIARGFSSEEGLYCYCISGIEIKRCKIIYIPSVQQALNEKSGKCIAVVDGFTIKGYLNQDFFLTFNQAIEFKIQKILDSIERWQKEQGTQLFG